MKSKFKLILLTLVLVNCSCSKQLKTFDFKKIETEKKSIVDLSRIIKFSNTDNEILIINKKYFNGFVDFLLSSKRNCNLLIQSFHEDRLYLATQQSNINKLKSLLLGKGIPESRLDAKIGLDFGTKYSKKLEKSSVIAIVE